MPARTARPFLTGAAGQEYAYSLNTGVAGRYLFTLGWTGAARLAQAEREGMNLEVLQKPSGSVAIIEATHWQGHHEDYLQRYGLVPHAGTVGALHYDGRAVAYQEAAIPNSNMTVFWGGGY